MLIEKVPALARFFHWGMAGVVVLNSFVLEAGDPPHRYLGYFCLALVVLRIITYKLKIEHYNPKATLAYIAIWAAILGLALTGWMMGLDRFWGDETLEEIHEIISNVLLGLVAIHLAGIAIDAIQNKRKTWMRMIDGRK